MDSLRSADEADAGEAVAPALEGGARRFAHRRVLRQAQVVVRTQVQDRGAITDRYPRALGGGDDPLGLVGAGGPDAGQLPGQMLLIL